MKLCEQVIHIRYVNLQSDFVAILNFHTSYVFYYFCLNQRSFINTK